MPNFAQGPVCHSRTAWAANREIVEQVGGGDGGARGARGAATSRTRRGASELTIPIAQDGSRASGTGFVLTRVEAVAVTAAVTVVVTGRFRSAVGSHGQCRPAGGRPGDTFAR